MKRVFVDTFYLLALVSPSDESHARALQFARAYRGRFITTQWVLTEMADGCAATANRLRAVEFIKVFSAQSNVTVFPVSDDWFQRGLRRYGERPDQKWSLTDCISFLVMEDEKLSEALTADHHFEQAGFVALLKQEIS